jgi:hypothetical protein
MNSKTAMRAWRAHRSSDLPLALNSSVISMNGNLMVPAGRIPLVRRRRSVTTPDEFRDSSMKTLSVVTSAIFLGFCSVAMAGNDNQDSQQSYTNATGPNPYMTFSAPSKLRTMWLAEDAFAMHLQNLVAHHHVKK